MRGTRWLVLVAIAAVLGGVAVTYRAQKRSLRNQAPPKPPALPLDLQSSAEDWHWAEFDPRGNRTTVEISARGVKQVKDSSRVELEGVALRIYHQDDAAFDLVTSARASFSATEKKLYSDGDVEITLGVPKDTPPAHRLVTIRSSGVSFDSATGQADTDRPASFVFQDGEGSCVGAFYDPPSRTLRMKSQSSVLWRTRGAKPKTMKIETGELQYHEAKNEIWLQPWSRLTRENSVVEGGLSMVFLKEGVARRIETHNARGIEIEPRRKLEFAAGLVAADLNEAGAAEKVTGDGAARVVSSTATSVTTMTGDHVFLNFVPGEDGSVLTGASGTGSCVVESKPVAAAGRAPPETHVLRAGAVRLVMRPDGRDIAEAFTDGPGDLEFLPNLPVQRYRKLSSQSMHIVYGPRSRVESCRAVEAVTLTQPSAEERKRNRAPSTTRSRNLLARFDAAGKLATMEQWDDFFYEEGGRKARAARAAMDGDSNVITLETAARVWDATGFTAGDHIRMDEKAGVFTAEGHVSSSRLPDQDKSKKQKTSEMLSGDDPTQATARKMTSTNHNRHVLYEGGVIMWQGANRILGDTVELDREKRTLVAEGHVVTHMWEQPQPPKDAAAKKKAAAPKAAVLTVVRAPRLVYTEQDRLAHYTGGVDLSRPAMRVKAAVLRAFLAEQGAESRLDKAFADGTVEIVQTAPDRTRTGTAEHAEYFTGEQKVILRGGAPQMVDSLRGTTRGAELTYFANDDRLLVNGSPEQPAGSRIRRK